MLIEGLIGYEKTNYSISNLDPNTIALENGYMKFIFDSNTHISFPYIINITSKKAETFKHSNHKCGNGNIFSVEFLLAKGNDCLNTLGIGIWYDENDGSIHIYRDLFGQVPIFYVHVPDVFFAFSTSLSSLLLMQPLSDYLALDTNRIIQYSLYAADTRESYSEDTFYRNIKSFLPGHLTTIDKNLIKSNLTFSFDFEKWNNLHTLEEYGEQFGYIFNQSINNIIGHPSLNISSQLSGGLDSSFISSIVKSLYPERNLHTIYCLTNTKYTNEINYAHSVSNHIGSIHHDVVPNEKNYLELLILYTSLYGHPERMVLGGVFQGCMMEYSAELGCNIALVGHPGDTIVGTGLDYFQVLFESEQWSEIKEILEIEITDSLETDTLSYYQQEQNYYKNKRLYNHVRSKLKTGYYVESFKLLSKLNNNFDISYSYFFERTLNAVLRKAKIKQSNFAPLLRKEWTQSSFNSSIGLVQSLPNHYGKWLNGIYTTQAIGFNEQFFSLGNYYNIGNKFPFYNKDLYELSLAVPQILKFDSGRGRGHLRQAMKGLVPENVRTRHDKAAFGVYGNEVALNLYEQAGDFITENSDVWEYLDRSAFLSYVNWIYKNRDKENKLFSLVIRGISLAVWLDIFKRQAFIIPS